MNRFERVLTGILSILLLAVAALALLLWQRGGIGSPPPLPTVNAAVAPTPDIVRSTALLAFSSAQAEARAWQPDARLVSATATWTQGASREDLLSGMATWDFTFESPGAGTVAILTVIEGDARLINERPASQTISVQDVSGWRVDSPAAVARAMQEGGEAFLNRAGVTTLTASLSTARTEDRIEWLVSLISKYTGDAFTVRIDATSGDVIAADDLS